MPIQRYENASGYGTGCLLSHATLKSALSQKWIELIFHMLVYTEEPKSYTNSYWVDMV